MKRPAAKAEVKALPAEGEDADEVDSSCRNLGEAFEQVADEEAPGESKPEGGKPARKCKPQAAKAEVKDKKAKNSVKDDKEKNAAEKNGSEVNDEMAALLKNRATFAGRRPPQKEEARERFIAMVSTYMTKIEPHITNTTSVQAGS